MARPGVAWRGGVASESIQWTRVSLVTQSVHACAACVGARRCGVSWTGACGADSHVYVCQRLLRAFVDGPCFLRVLQRE